MVVQHLSPADLDRDGGDNPHAIARPAVLCDERQRGEHLGRRKASGARLPDPLSGAGRKLAPLKHQESEEKRLRDFQLSDTLKRQCLAVARSIGSQFRSARIDLIIGDDGRIYLNEVTLSSSAGKPWLDRKEDQRMGRLWRGADLFDLSQAIEP